MDIICNILCVLCSWSILYACLCVISRCTICALYAYLWFVFLFIFYGRMKDCGFYCISACAFCVLFNVSRRIYVCYCQCIYVLYYVFCMYYAYCLLCILCVLSICISICICIAYTLPKYNFYHMFFFLYIYIHLYNAYL